MTKVTGLGHVGLYVRDPAIMVDFYQNFLGMTVTDRAKNDWIVFLSARPEAEHHELALVRSEDQKSNPQQVSFTVASLSDLKAFWSRIKVAGFPVDSVVNHGIAFGCYFRDPEGNRIELYWSTGISFAQPKADPIDLSLPEAELLALLEARPIAT